MMVENNGRQSHAPSNSSDQPMGIFDITPVQW